ncbi:MAG: hypothetical protein GY777_05840 [Candidatus Brocadiaceae bacterium]|nr:hypothetical protein [Candidatus Brocadiaceae bacterium]
MHSYGVDRATLLQRKRRIPFEARDVSMYVTYTGLTNKAVRELFGVSISAVNKAELRICMRRKTSENFRRRTEKLVYSIFKV